MKYNIYSYDIKGIFGIAYCTGYVILGANDNFAVTTKYHLNKESLEPTDVDTYLDDLNLDGFIRENLTLIATSLDWNQVINTIKAQEV